MIDTLSMWHGFPSSQQHTWTRPISSILCFKLARNFKYFYQGIFMKENHNDIHYKAVNSVKTS